VNERRWQPPPMNPPPRPEAVSTPTVDEKVVRKILQVNPTLRQGRTTAQVKKALERGEPAVPAGAAKGPVAAGELEDAMGFFLRGKSERLRDGLAGIAARRRALEQEEAELRTQLREQLAAFVSLLDAAAVDTHGARVLAKHHDFLGALSLTPASVLELARRGR
jgi:hypothetical protein